MRPLLFLAWRRTMLVDCRFYDKRTVWLCSGHCAHPPFSLRDANSIIGRKAGCFVAVDGRPGRSEGELVV